MSKQKIQQIHNKYIIIKMGSKIKKASSRDIQKIGRLRLCRKNEKERERRRYGLVCDEHEQGPLDSLFS